ARRLQPPLPPPLVPEAGERGEAKDLTPQPPSLEGKGANLGSPSPLRGGGWGERFRLPAATGEATDRVLAERIAPYCDVAGRGANRACRAPRSLPAPPRDRAHPTPSGRGAPRERRRACAGKDRARRVARRPTRPA